jgi:hypothetical protein
MTVLSEPLNSFWHAGDYFRLINVSSLPQSTALRAMTAFASMNFVAILLADVTAFHFAGETCQNLLR